MNLFDWWWYLLINAEEGEVEGAVEEEERWEEESVAWNTRGGGVVTWGYRCEGDKQGVEDGED